MNLRIENLIKTYHSRRSTDAVKALNQINLEIGKGMFGLLGPNGAGKSSLMRTIATLQEPDEGNIHFFGIDVLKQPMELKKVLGYLPQDFGVYPQVSADSLLQTFAILKGITSSKTRKLVIDKVLELTNLTDVRKKHVSGYSGGMKQRFGIAQLLLHNPKLIIVDEPTAGLDPAERTRFLNVLRDIGIENTVLFSTHLVDDVADLCNDLAIINRGKVLLHRSPDKILSDLQGKIFTKNISKAELPSHELQYFLLSSSYNSDNSIRIRIQHNQAPTGFERTAPGLEDAYFLALKEQFQQNTTN